MASDNKRKSFGDKIIKNLKDEHGIVTRRIEDKNDLNENNVLAIFKPKKDRVEIKLRSY